MRLQDPFATAVSTNLEQIARCLPICSGERLVELGCGLAETTRRIAEMFPELEIIATEVDEIQQAKNISIDDLPNVSFGFGGAEKIDLPDQSVNYIVMLKSLHHVPVPLMGQSLDEINRVLVPGGLAFIAEPIYAGDFNSILRLFNDEQKVLREAFAAIKAAVASGKFELVEQVFFDTIVHFLGFAEYESRILNATHLDMDVDQSLRERIKSVFEPFVNSDGIAEFRAPTRIDLLKRSQ